MKRKIGVFLFGVMCVCTCALAGEIASLTREGSGGFEGIPGQDAVILPLGWCTDGDEECGGEVSEIFDTIFLQVATIGRPIVVDDSNKMQFNAVVAGLTNDIPDFLRFRTYIFPPIGNVDEESVLEADAFFPNVEYAVDFAGATIEKIQITLEELDFDTPGSDPNGDGNWTDYTFRVTYSIMGIPAPVGNCDEDDRSDLGDWWMATECMRNPNVPVIPECRCTDADLDGDLDLRDVAAFQRAFYPDGL